MTDDIVEHLLCHKPTWDRTELMAKAANEITRLRSELEEARAAISRYLDERDAPVKDYTLIHIYRDNLRALFPSPKEKT